MSALLAALQNGSYLTRERARLWAPAFLIGFALAIAGVIVSAHGNIDYDGRPLGTDFSSFYAAGRLALEHRSPFDQAALHRMQQEIFGASTPYYAFSYPPIFLLIAAPLARLPYLAALLVWEAAGIALYLAAMTRLRRKLAPAIAGNGLFFALVLAFTATFITLIHGQNGFLAAALFAWAISLLDDDAWAAGLCFGLMAFKPQLALLVPFALAGGGRWKSFAAAAVTVLVLVCVSVLLFGIDAWREFLAASAFSKQAILDQGAVGYDKMVSVFAWMRLWHLTPFLAYGAQFVAGLAVIGAILWLWRSPANLRIKGAGLCLGSLLVTPFALDYDLMLLAPAILLMTAEAEERTPYEATVIAALWLIPAAARTIAATTALPLAVWAVATGLSFVLRRVPARA